jgi:hypothetical protein
MNTIKIFIGNHSDEVSTWNQLFNEKVENATIEIVHGNDMLKRNCQYLLYIFTPETEGVRAIIDVVNDSNRFTSKVIFFIINENEKFTKHQLKSLKATGKMVELNGGKWFDNMENLIEYLEKT